MRLIQLLKLLVITLSTSHILMCNGESVSCTGHDACKNKIWNGEYDISCGAANSERTCKSTTLNCAVDGDCTIKTQGSGHDAYQSSTVNAKESNSFKLTCQASGARDCKTITVWCPQGAGTSCECVSCPSTVTMKCVQGVSCSSVSNANIEYVEPDQYQIPDSVWDKDSTHTGKRPDCSPALISAANTNYKWATLEQCKKTCIEEPTGKCNMVSRYGETTKTATENYHCRFYSCPNPTNFTWITQAQWGNYAAECNTYKLPIRHFLEDQSVTCTNIINKTVYNNETIYQYRNISDYFYDEIMLESICNEGRYTYYTGTSNEAWTTKSWKVGCNQYKLGYKTLNQCKSQCSCNNSPSSFSSHSKYKTCSKIDASTNYIPCRQNSCSGGSCCSRSTNICKDACRAFHAIKFAGKMVTYTDKDRYTDIIRNTTRIINVTKNIIRYINETVYHDVWQNKTRWIERIKWKNETRVIYKVNWTNLTRIINKTKFRDEINWINKIQWQNKTRWFEKIRWNNKTKWNNQTKWINQTRWIEKIKWKIKDKVINVTREIIIEIPIYTNITIYKNATYPIKNGIQPDSNHVNPEDTKLTHTNQNSTDCEVSSTNKIFQIGFFITLGCTIFCLFIIAWHCGLKDIVEEFIDDLCCCGCRDNIQCCRTFCGICMECYEEEEKQKYPQRNVVVDRSREFEMNKIFKRDDIETAHNIKIIRNEETGKIQAMI